MNGSRYEMRILAALLYLISGAGMSALNAGEMTLVRTVTDCRVAANGDAVIKSRTTFSEPRRYQELKDNFPNPHQLTRHLFANNNRAILNNPSVRYDDRYRAVDITVERKGLSWARRGRREIRIEDEVKAVHVAPGLAVFAGYRSGPPATVYAVSLTYRLPEVSSDVRYDSVSRILSYVMPKTAAGGGESRLECDLEARQNIMSSLYKIYAHPELMNGCFWVAKAVFHNDGDGEATDLRISYRVGDFAPWSPEARYDVVPAGGTVVDCYYPLFRVDTMRMVNPTPVDVEVRYSYRDSRGGRHEDSYAERSRILGRNSFAFSSLPDSEAVSWNDRLSNAPLLAAFVAGRDPLLREFADIAAQASGVTGIPRDDDEAMAFCRAVYEQMAANGISYQTAASFLTERDNLVQEIKHPRDILKDKSGTCVELAALYASVCEAKGLKTGLAVIPGHCFSLVKLPSGKILPVENTGLGGAAVGKHLSFAKAVALGEEELAEVNPNLSFVMDVGAMQNGGVVPPEFPDSPANGLKDWGIYLRKTERQTPSTPADKFESEKTQIGTPEADLSGRWEAAGKNTLTGKDLSFTFEIFLANDKYDGFVVLPNRGGKAEITRLGETGGKINVESVLDDGTEKLVFSFAGKVADGVWSGQYAVMENANKSVTAAGSFTARKGGAVGNAGDTGDRRPDNLPPPSKPSATPTGLRARLAGIWEGTYTAQGRDYPIRLDLQGQASNATGGTAYMPEEGITAEIFAFDAVGGSSNGQVKIRAKWMVRHPEIGDAVLIANFLGRGEGDKLSGDFTVEIADTGQTVSRGVFKMTRTTGENGSHSAPHWR